ncbi:MAG: hypothetical protein U0V04_04885 [Spirosomataceae bacterium]
MNLILGVSIFCSMTVAARLVSLAVAVVFGYFGDGNILKLIKNFFLVRIHRSIG